MKNNKAKGKKVVIKNEEKQLNVLITLYNCLLTDITFYQNSGNSIEAIGVISAIAMPVFQLLKVDSAIQSIVCLVFPFIQAVGLQRGLESHSFVAMLRGYAAFVEKKINKIIGENIFLYNSELVDEYIAKQKIGKNKPYKGIKYSMLITIVSQILINSVSVFFFYLINTKNSLPIWTLSVSGIWFTLCIAFDLLLCIDFVKKEQVREKAKNYSFIRSLPSEEKMENEQ